MPTSSVLLFLASVISISSSADILGVFMFPSFSHQINYQPLWRELSLRGHRVTVVTPNPLKDSTLTNLTEIDIAFTYNLLKEYQTKLFNADMVKNWDTIFRFMDTVAESELSFPDVQDLLTNRSKRFDLIIVECFHPVMYALGGRFQAPIIGITPVEVIAVDYERFGNPSHPLLNPDHILGFDPYEMTMFHKIQSVAFNLLSRFYYKFFMLPRSQQLADLYFGTDIPPLAEIERHVSFLFLNRNPLIFPARATVPAVVQLGLMHIQDNKPLSEDLQLFLDNATEGVIYFSLGSNIQSTFVSEKLFNVFVKAFEELPYKVLWKCNCNITVSSNVMIRTWLPQQDVLAHPNVRGFVTQGGPQSIEEAIAFEVPMVGMAFMTDQPINVKKIVDLGIAISVSHTHLTKELLINSIVEVVENATYKQRIREIRQLLFDKPMCGLEKAVWWAEYTIRHKGAKHLRSLSVDVTWFEFLMVDVVLTTLLGFSFLYYLSKKVIETIKKKML